MVLLCGEAGIGDSRLVQVVKAHVAVRKRHRGLLSGVARVLLYRLLHRVSAATMATWVIRARCALTVAEAGRVPGSAPSVAAAIRV